MCFKKAISFFLLFALLFLNLISCNNSNSNENDGQKGDNLNVDKSDKGFTSIQSEIPGDPDPSLAFVDYTAEKTTFNIDEVEITFHYGFAWYSDINIHYAKGDVFPYVDLTFAYLPKDYDVRLNPDGKIEIPIKRVENIMTDEYRCTSKQDESDPYGLMYYIQYNHSEKITLPVELFSEDEGSVFFTLYYEGINELDGSSIFLYETTSFYFVKTSENTIKIYPSIHYVQN